MIRSWMLLATLASTVIGSQCIADEITGAKQAVLIKVILGTGDPDAAPAKRRVLAEPTIATLLGRPATMQSGGEVLSDPRDKQSPSLPFGTTLRVSVDEAGSGKVKGELRLEVTSVSETKSDDVVAATGIVIHQAGTFTLGKTYRLHSRDQASTWAEVTITEAGELSKAPPAEAPRR